LRTVAVVFQGRSTSIGGPISSTEARINDRIRAREVFLVGAEGEQLGVKPLPEALAIAREQDLDLVEVAANASPPVCRIMNFGRFKYEQEQKRKESRKKTTNIVVKEMKFRPKITSHDYMVKMKYVERFLGEGAKVKLTIMFRGREMAHPEMGRKILDQVATDVAEMAAVEQYPKQDGRNMTMVLAPTRKPGTKKPKPEPDAGATPQVAVVTPVESEPVAEAPATELAPEESGAE
jgi:translation initiation factor IF-3